jgi:hypothetical protein
MDSRFAGRTISRNFLDDQVLEEESAGFVQMRCGFAADLLIGVEEAGKGLAPIGACVNRCRGGVLAEGSERPRVENIILGRHFRRHLRVAWAIVVRRTSFPGKDDKVWLAAEVELVNLVTKLFRQAHEGLWLRL